MTHDPEQIAAGLTKGEREALFALPESMEWWPKTERHHLGPDYPRDAIFFMWANKSPLIEARGYTTGFSRARLTHLGLAVRALISKEKDNG